MAAACVFATPMLWSLGFMVTFVIGGMTGVLLAVPPADFVLHNSLFLVAHFHNVIIGGVVFGAFAGYTYWFPKAFGFRLHEGWGKAAFWCWLVGFYVAFMPLYVAGPDGHDAAHAALRRAGLASLAADRGRRRGDHPASASSCQIVQLVVSIRQREELRDVTGDPWDGRSLEWSTPSPPPAFNFAVLPQVEGEDAYWGIKQRARQQARLQRRAATTQPIEMPRNSPTGFVCAFFATVMGFALIWHIWWLVGVGLRRRLRDLRRLRLARRTEDDHSGRGRRAHRPRQPARARRGAGRAAGAGMSASTQPPTAHDPRAAIGARPDQRRRGPASKRIVVGYGFWIFLLSDIVMFSALLRGLRGAGRTRPPAGPSGRELFDLRNVAIETACLLLSSFTCGMAASARSARNALWYLWRAWRRPSCSARRSSALELQRVRRHDRAGRRPDAQRLPVGLLHAGRLPRPARDRRPALAADDDGAGVRQGLPRRHPAPRCSASACSGTRWTSSGSACSPSSI